MSNNFDALIKSAQAEMLTSRMGGGGSEFDSAAGTLHLTGGQQEDQSGSMARGFKESFQQLPQLGWGLVAGAGAAAESALGEGGISSAIKDRGIKGYKEWEDEIAKGAKESDSWNYSYEKAKEGDLGALSEWLKHSIGYVGGQALQTLATAGVGAIGGKLVAGTAARQLAEKMVAKEASKIAAEQVGKDVAEQLSMDAIKKQATKNVTAKFANIGQQAAVGANAFGMEGGEIFGDLTSANKDRVLTGAELGRALGATIGAGALEFVGDKVGLDVMLGKSRLLKPTESLGHGGGIGANIAGRAVRGGVAGTIAAPLEGGTEYLQTGLEEYGKGNEEAMVPWAQSEKAQAQALDAAALGAVGGMVVGGAGGAIHGPVAPETTNPNAAPRTVADVIKDAADQPNSPLSRAAVAGNQDPAQASTESTATQGQDPILARVSEIETAVRDGGLVQKLREIGSQNPDLASNVVAALATAKNSRLPASVRQGSLEVLEDAMRALQLEPINQVGRQWQGLNIGQQDGSLSAHRAATIAGSQWQGLGIEQPSDALAAQGNLARAGAAWQQGPGAAMPAGPVSDASGVSTVVDQSGSPASTFGQTPANGKRAPASVAPAIDKIAIHDRYTPPPGESSPTLANNPGQSPTNPGQSVAAAVAAEEPERPRKTVSAPAVDAAAMAAAGDISLSPSVRRRRAQLAAMVKSGFDAVEQRDGKFFLVNHADNYEMPLENAGDAARATAIISAKVDNEAHQSINSPLNDKNPATEAQIAADNYSKPSVRRFGLTFKTENPAGSTRSGKDASGKAWSIDMNHHYTGIEGTRSSDGGLVDAFLGSGHRIFVIDQIDPKTGKHDEPKVMAGFRSEEEARKAYLSNYSAGWKGLGAITEMTVPQFRKWVKSSAAALPVSPTIKTSQEVKNDGRGNQAAQDAAAALASGDSGRRDSGAPADGGLRSDGPVAQGVRDGQNLEQGNAGEAQGSARDPGVERLAIDRLRRAIGKNITINEVAQDDPRRVAIEPFMDVMERKFGKRGILVEMLGEGADDGVQLGGDYYVNVDMDNIIQPLAWTIIHEFGHTKEEGPLRQEDPGLAALTRRMWDLIPASAREAYFDYLKKTGQTMGADYAHASDSDLVKLRSEMLKDFMGQRFDDREWLQRLGKEKPNLFAEFVRDWLKLLDNLIEAFKGRLNQLSRRGGLRKDIDLLMRDHIKELEAMKTIALDVAAEWAQSHRAMAQRTGVSQAIQSAKESDVAHSARPLTDQEINDIQAELDAELSGAQPEIEPDVSDAAIRRAGIHAEDAFPPHKWSGGGDQHTLSIKGLYGGERTVRLSIDKVADGQYETSIEGAWVGPASDESTGYVSLKGAKSFIDRQIAARELRARGYDLTSSLPAEQRAALREGWEAINALGDEFGVRRYPLTSELDTSIQDLAKSMGLTEAYKVTSNEEVNDRDNKTLVIAFTDKATGKTQSGTVSMTRFGGKWHTSASTIEFKKGGLGTAFYQLAVEYLARKGLQLSPEATLSGINTYRRTEQMLAAALRIGISNAMVPHPVQRVYGFQNDAQSDAEHAANLERLLIANLRNVRELVPQFDRLRYHPETGAITFKNGRDAEKVVDQLIGHKGEKLTTQTDARAFGLGRTTLARALMTQAMLDGKFQEPESFAEPVTYSARDQAAIEYAAVEAQYKGTPQWMKAPNGNPTQLSERQWVQVRTPMFQKWFGPWEKFAGLQGGVWNDDKGEVSKVVDENGEPMVVYHGSDKGGFMAFETPGGQRRGDLGIFTTSDYDMARSYVRRGRANDVDAVDQPRTKAELEAIGYSFLGVDGVGYSYLDDGGYETGGFETEDEAVESALANYESPHLAGSQPGIYALFINLRNPSESDFEGATWGGSREHQWVVEVGGEIQADANGTQYFDSKEDAAEFAKTFVADDAEGDDADPLSYVRGADDHYESTDDVVREAWSFGNDGAIIRNVIDDGGGPGGYMGEPRDVFVARHGGQLKSANWNTGEFGQSTDDLRYSKRQLEGLNPKVVSAVQGVEEVAKHLTPEERSKLRADTAKKMMDIYAVLPSVDDMAAAAYAGKAKRGWYRHSRDGINHIFGADAWRFAALLAATSPQQSVEMNLQNTLNIWKNWDAAGRPKDRKSILRVMGESVSGNRGEDSVLDAWVNNSVAALSASSFGSLVLSGPKVDSFMRNLTGDLSAVTNDAWMANYALIDQILFSGNLNAAGTEPGKRSGYLAMNALVRAAAKKLKWQPAEVQETVWSWSMSLLEMMDAQGESRGAIELMDAGALSDEVIGKTKDFRILFHEPRYASILNEAGYGERLGTLSASVAPEDNGPPPFTEAKMRKLLGVAGTRLEFLQRQRRTNVQISWEARPGESTGVLPGMHDAPLELQQRYLADVFAAIESAGFKDKTGLSLRNTLFGPSAWEGKVLAGAQTMTRPGVVADNHGSVKVDGASRARMATVSSVLGLVLNQEGVYWHWPIYKGGKPEHENGVEIDYGRSLTNPEMAALYAAITKKAGHSMWAPANTPTGVRVLNFSDTPNKEFHKVIRGAADWFAKKHNVESKTRTFGSDGDAVENNWKDHPDGQEYLARLREAGRSDLLGWANGELQAAVDAVNRRYSEQHGWGAPTRADAQRSARDDASAGRGGHLDPAEPDLQRSAKGPLAERQDQPAAGGRPDRALRVQGAVHFGKAPGLSVLSGSASGTGIKGAEQERLNQAGVDPRLKRRVYFYLPVDGGIPQPEIGLGTHVYKADLGNLYDPAEGKIRGEGNPFELAVLNAGYDGYVNREQGTAVLLNRDAPVSYEGRSYDHKLVQRRIERVIPKTVTRQSGDELVRRPEASELGSVIRNREAIKAAAPSFRMEFGEARVKADEAPAADAALEKAGSPFRFGEVNMSARDVKIENHDKWSIYQEKSAQIGDGFIRWVQDPSTAYVTDIQAGPETRGRAMLEWLKSTSGKDLYAVGVVDDAEEFWDRMEEDGLITGQTDEDFMSFFGRGVSKSARDVTETPEFKAWFGDSKVVDAEGRPLVVYHGTDAEDFSVFARESHFGTSAAANERLADRGDESARILPVYLSIERPLRVTDAEASDEATLLNAIKRGKYKDIDLNTAARKGMVRALEDAEYDGLIYKNRIEDRGRDSWVAFRPEQIKSATGNNGDFDASNPDITRSARDSLEQYLDYRNKSLKDVNPLSVLEDDIARATVALQRVVTAMKTGKYVESAAVPIGPVPHTLRMLGAPMQMLKMDTSIVRKVLVAKHGDHFHDITAREFVEGIYRPALVLNGDRPMEVEIVSSILTDDGPIMFALKSNVQLSPASPKVTAVMSAYQKPIAGGGNTIARRILDGKLIYADMLTAQQAITGQEVKSQSQWTGFENSEARGKGSANSGPDSTALPQTDTSGVNVAEAKRLVKPYNKSYAGWALVKKMVLDGVASKRVKTDVDLVGWIAKRYKGDIADVPSFSARSPIGFYSELSEQVEKSTMRQAQAAAWKTFIKALSQKGVKPDEVEWTGVNEWLDLQEGKVSKDALLDYLGANGVQVEEKVLGGGGSWVVEWGSGDRQQFGSEQEAREALDAEVRLQQGMANQAEIEFDPDLVGSVTRATSEDGGTKYGRYTLPGGPLSRDTEILSREGWIRMDEVQVGDIVMTRRDEDGALEWQEVEAVPEVFADKLYHFKNQSINMRVTACHNMLVKRRRRSRTGLQRVKADQLWSMAEMVAPLTGLWSGSDDGLLYGNSASDVAELIGWYISEGSAVSEGGKKSTLAISQSRKANPEKCERIEALLNRLGIKWNYVDSGPAYYLSIKTMDRGLVDVLHAQGSSRNKFVPGFMFDKSAPVLERLMEGLLLGDGCRVEQAGRLPRWTYHTNSKQLADDVQVLALMTGKRGTISRRANGLYAVAINSKQWASIDDAKHALTDYNDTAYCVTVKNHAIYVRTDGVAAFTGNSNYREVLLTLPQKTESPIRAAIEAKYPGKVGSELYRAATDSERAAWDAEMAQLMNANRYSSPHWDQANVLAHIRLTDRRSATEPHATREVSQYLAGSELAPSLPLNVVESGVAGLIDHNEVRRAVISALPVDVVDMLRSIKLTPEQLLGNEPVSANLASAPLAVRFKVLSGLVSALGKTEARIRAKVRSSLVTGFDEDVLPALRTSDLDPAVVRRLLAPVAVDGNSKSSALSPELGGARSGAALSDSGGAGRELGVADRTRLGDLFARASLGAEPAGGSLVGRDGVSDPAALANLLNSHAKIINDRTDADGKRVLFVEEIQSDWGQAGKRDGFANPGELDALLAEKARIVAMLDAMPDGTPDSERLSAGGRLTLVQDAILRLQDKPAIPRAPFVTHTDKWLNLALKRIITMAVEGGYDKIAFTDAEPHFKRWGTERIDWAKQPDGSFLVKAKSQEGGVAAGINLEAEAIARGLSKTNSKTVRSVKELEDVIRPALTEGQKAEDLAPKIWQRMQAEDAGIAMPRREGFEAFYGDKNGINPKTGAPSFLLNGLKALAKKLGGEVGEVELVRRNEGGFRGVPGITPMQQFEATEVRSTQPGLTITPAMREKVEDGLPLFSKRDATWSDDRIDRLMSKYAYTMDDNRTKAYAAWVRPQDFLDATTPADFKGKLESEKSPLDKDQLMREVQEIQLISRDHPKSGGVFKTEGHEGRHRMMALRDAGVERVPVTLTIPTKNGAEPLTSVFVSAQKWSGGPSAQSGFTVERMIPISWAHHDELKAEFGGEGEVSFSAKDQTETPEFKKWFGNSRVVDESGAPLRVFTGTSKDVDFKAFKVPKNGVWFTTDPESASQYAVENDSMDIKTKDYRTFEHVNTASRVIPAYLRIENPYKLSDAEMDRIRYASNYKREQGQLFDSVRARGYDGVDMGGGTWVVLKEPAQIKSSVGNNGDFDGGKGDISRSARDDDYALRQSSREIVGGVGRTYTADQKAAFARVGFEVEQPSLKERAQALWKDAGKKLAQGLFDQFAPVRELSQDAYGLLRLAKGSAGSFETLLKGGKLKLTDGVYDFDESQRGGVIDRLLIPMQGEHHDFLRWVAANRAEGLLAEGRENLFAQDDIDAIKTLQDGQLNFDYTLQHGPRAGSTTRVRAEMYADSLKTFNEFNKNVLDMASQSGLIDEESRHLWEGEFYVPFYRVSEEDGLQGANIKGGVVRQKAFQKLKGGKDVLNADLLDNTLMNWAHLLDASAKNRAAKATLEAAEVAGAAIPASEDIARQIGKATGNRHGVVWFMDQGMQRFYLVEDPYLMSAITSLEYAGMKNPVMNAMSAVKHYLTVGVTASPFFKVRNLIRDSVQAVASAELSYNPGKNLAEGWAASDQKGDLYFRLLAGGGTIHFGTMLEGSETRRVQALVEAGVNPDNILDNSHKLVAFYKRRIKPAIDAYNELGNRGETINRAALYKQLIAQGKSHAEASLMARDLMDFSMQGNFATIRFLTQVVPFLNARLQGLNKLGKAARENPQRMAMVMGAVAMLSLSLLALYGDDDDWKRREDWDRDNFWWFKIGGIAYRVPKPFEVGAFGTLAERSAELIFSDEMTADRFRSRVMALLGDNLSMNPVPQLVKPMLDVYANKDSFSGRPIETMGMDRLQAPYRFTANTSMTARAASTAMNAVTGLVGKESLSPVQVDSLIRGYFGWLGTFIVGGVDIVARKATDQPTRPTPDLWKVATGGMISQLDDAKSRYVSQVYDQARAIEQAYGTWRSLQKEGKTEQAADFKEANIEKIQAYRNVEAIKGAISKINQRIRDVESSDLSRDEKRDEVRRLNQRKDEFSRRLAPA